MNDDQIKRLLQQAYRDSQTPQFDPANVAREVVRLGRRHKIRNAFSAVAAAAAAVILAVVVWMHYHSVPQTSQVQIAVAPPQKPAPVVPAVKPKRETTRSTSYYKLDLPSTRNLQNINLTSRNMTPPTLKKIMPRNTGGINIPKSSYREIPAININ